MRLSYGSVLAGMGEREGMIFGKKTCFNEKITKK